MGWQPMIDSDFNSAAYCAESDECELILSFCQLVDIMVKDIQHLEAECVRSRYQVSKHLGAPDDGYYRSNILSGLKTPYYDNLAYQMYMALYYDGGDPLSFQEWISAINRLAKGHEDDRF